MIITLLNQKDKAWPYFLKFCRKSQPYKAFSCGSPSLRDKMIKNYFEDFRDTCDIYEVSNENGVMIFLFLSEELHFYRIRFSFGLSDKFKTSELIEGFHAAMDSLGPKYFVSEVRRTKKLESYKKWIDRHDNRCIILNNEDQTMLWSSSKYMKGKMTVVGTNGATEKLLGKEAEYGKVLEIDKSLNVSTLTIGSEKYLFDAKKVSFFEKSAMIEGFVSNDINLVGKLTLEFKP